MHTLNTKTCVFFFNSDFSGTIELHSKLENKIIKIPFSDLQFIVAEQIKRDKISSIENMDDLEILQSIKL